jgi:hypothetical protein
MGRDGSKHVNKWIAACANQPKISSQTAPQADLTRCHTHEFMEKLGTDTAGYTSITTRLMKDAVSRELAARGFAPGDNPDILVNFLAATKDKVEGHSDPRWRDVRHRQGTRSPLATS